MNYLFILGWLFAVGWIFEGETLYYNDVAHPNKFEALAAKDRVQNIVNGQVYYGTNKTLEKCCVRIKFLKNSVKFYYDC